MTRSGFKHNIHQLLLFVIYLALVIQWSISPIHYAHNQ